MTAFPSLLSELSFVFGPFPDITCALLLKNFFLNGARSLLRIWIFAASLDHWTHLFLMFTLYNTFFSLSSVFVHFYVFHKCKTITLGKTHSRSFFGKTGCRVLCNDSLR